VNENCRSQSHISQVEQRNSANSTGGFLSDRFGVRTKSFSAQTAEPLAESRIKTSPTMFRCGVIHHA
jgi:hypothetical protein